MSIYVDNIIVIIKIKMYLTIMKHNFLICKHQMIFTFYFKLWYFNKLDHLIQILLLLVIMGSLILIKIIGIKLLKIWLLLLIIKFPYLLTSLIKLELNLILKGMNLKSKKRNSKIKNNKIFRNLKIMVKINLKKVKNSKWILWWSGTLWL